MSKIINDKKVFSLFEVTQSIKKTISSRYNSAFWVKAEMHKLNFYKQSGHCFPELIEKAEGKVIAQMQSIFWKNDYTRINNNFQKVLNEPLKDGVKILFLAQITFEPVYGLSLRILDIDPSYTLGDLEREKQESILKLKQEGLFDKNRTLTFPMLPKRIAVISIESSKGYQDFLGKIRNNAWGYGFFYFLFPSLLQGDKVVQSITEQLNNIKRVKDHFDVVAIIRGGGGDAGLSSYNNYKLAKNIAKFPLPVLTGIGHITNETVVEMVSHKNLITPTDLADYLIQSFHNFSIPVKEAEQIITDRSKRIINEEKEKFQYLTKYFRSVAKNILIENRSNINGLVQSVIGQSRFHFITQNEILHGLRNSLRKGQIRVFQESLTRIRHSSRSVNRAVNSQLNTFKLILAQHSRNLTYRPKMLLDALKLQVDRNHEKIADKSFTILRNEKNSLNSVERSVNNMSPQEVLRRGYSITILEGKAITNTKEVKEGDSINTILFNGKIISSVTKK